MYILKCQILFVILDTCPNINNKRGFGAMKYLMYRKYMEEV